MKEYESKMEGRKHEIQQRKQELFRKMEEQNSGSVPGPGGYQQQPPFPGQTGPRFSSPGQQFGHRMNAPPPGMEPSGPQTGGGHFNRGGPPAPHGRNMPMIEADDPSQQEMDLEEPDMCPENEQDFNRPGQIQNQKTFQNRNESGPGVPNNQRFGGPHKMGPRFGGPNSGNNWGGNNQRFNGPRGPNMDNSGNTMDGPRIVGPRGPRFNQRFDGPNDFGPAGQTNIPGPPPGRGPQNRFGPRGRGSSGPRNTGPLPLMDLHFNIETEEDQEFHEDFSQPITASDDNLSGMQGQFAGNRGRGNFNDDRRGAFQGRGGRGRGAAGFGRGQQPQQDQIMGQKGEEEDQGFNQQQPQQQNKKPEHDGKDNR